MIKGSKKKKKLGWIHGQLAVAGQRAGKVSGWAGAVMQVGRWAGAIF